MLPWLILILALVVIAIAAAVAFYYWQTRLNIPILKHTPLPPYEIPDVILVGGLVVENRGRQPAPNVKITIQFDPQAATMIHHLQVKGAENAILRSGGERHNFATVSLKSLRPHGALVIYWAAARAVQPQINVTSYQPTKETFLDKFLPRKNNA
ncbi:MAG: hypothetical protein HY741_09275 [Chloroflexi bacterium]|nr:hypothetical protein [Chloroflexota bacterium]